MATSTSPIMIHKPLVDWDQRDVETFLNNNKGKYFFDDACVDLIVAQDYSGRGLLMLTRDELVGNGMRPGDATTIMSLITDLKLAMGVRDPRKWNLDSFSNSAYMLTVLSLKLLPLVSEQKRSGAGILFLLCTLANLTVVQAHVPDWTNSNAILDWIETYKRPDGVDQPKVCYFIIHFLEGTSDCLSLSRVLAPIFHSCIESPPSTHYGTEIICETGSWFDSTNSALMKWIETNTQFPC